MLALLQSNTRLLLPQALQTYVLAVAEEDERPSTPRLVSRPMTSRPETSSQLPAPEPPAERFNGDQVCGSFDWTSYFRFAPISKGLQGL